MAVQRIPIEQLPQFIENFEKSMLRAANRGLVMGAYESRSHVIDVLDRTTPRPVWRGPMREAFVVMTSDSLEGPGVHATIRNTATGSISGEPYFSVLDQGTDGQRMPPFAPIYDWVSEKLAPAADEPERKRLTNAVRRKLAREGIEPRRIMERSMDGAGKAAHKHIAETCDTMFRSL